MLAVYVEIIAKMLAVYVEIIKDETEKVLSRWNCMRSLPQLHNSLHPNLDRDNAALCKPSYSQLK